MSCVRPDCSKVRVDRVLGQDRGKGKEEGELTVRVLRKGESHTPFANLFHLRDLLQPVRKGRAAVVAQKFEREDDIVCRHLLAVRPVRLRIEIELDEGPVVVHFDCLGQQSIEGEGFVRRTQHQRLENQAAVLRIPKPPRSGAHALENKWIETVEGADDSIGDGAPFRSRRIGIGEIAVVRGQGGFAMHGDRMHGLGVGKVRCAVQEAADKQCNDAGQQSQLAALPKRNDSAGRLPRHATNSGRTG